MATINYDAASPPSIEEFGQRLVGSTLRKTKGIRETPSEFLGIRGGEQTKGLFGTLVEKYYYGIEPGNKPCSPDFVEAGVELKTNALVKTKKGISSKERLVLQMIDYSGIVEESFDSSCFMKKSKLMMLISHKYEANKNLADVRVEFAQLIDFDGLPEIDKSIIQEDWTAIASKIKSGQAHLLSGSDTTYLEACTKAADSSKEVLQPNSTTKAKPRAFALKAGYVTSLVRRAMEANHRSSLGGISDPDEQYAITDASAVATDGFEATILKRFDRFIGLGVSEIEARIGSTLNRSAKGYRATLARHMIGVTTKNVTEFERAGIEIKTILLDKKGNSPEHMSFPGFKYMGDGSILQEDWDAIEDLDGPKFKRHLEATRFLFVVFSEVDNTVILKRVLFWSMPKNDIEDFVRPVWQQTVDSILEGNLQNLPGSKFNGVCHVRPHAKNRDDTLPTPHNGPQVKKCFWLDKGYIMSQIA